MFFNKIITKERGRKKFISVLGMVKIGMISNAKVRSSELAKAGYGNKIRGGKRK